MIRFKFLFQESQPVTGSSASSKRASMRSHTVIPEINIISEQLKNSLQNISLENNQHDRLKKSSLENLYENTNNICVASKLSEPFEASKSLLLW